MGLLTYPRSIWTPQAYWARQRNAAGQRIRVDGARMNAAECCCNSDPCTICSGSGTPESVTVVIPTIPDGVNITQCDAFNDCGLFDGTYVLDRFFVASSEDICTAQYSLTLTPQQFCRDSFGIRDWFVGLWFQWSYNSVDDETTLLLRTIYIFTFFTTTPPTPVPNSSTPFVDQWELVQSGLLPCSGGDVLMGVATDTGYDRCEADSDAEVSW